MYDYSTTRALDYTTLQSLIDDLYAYDVNQYLQLKKHEGQYAYFDYVDRVQRAVNHVFYKALPGRSNNIAGMIESSSLPRSSETCIILNNNSLLGHVTVLRSIGNLLQKYSRNGVIKIVALTKGPHEQVSQWKKALVEANLQVFDLSKSNMTDRFFEVENLLKPRQYIWWGWPPGQWIGPLLSKNAVHRSVSFKYDFPVAKGFQSHHIGYGIEYASHIYDECMVVGFNQYFLPNLIPSFSEQKKQSSIEFRLVNNKNLAHKDLIHLGTLARSEKIAQPAFLETVKNIMLNDRRVMFHWTGREQHPSTIEFFKKYGLSKRHIFHGWVQPYDYLKHLDIYLDTFPFGTGETFVLAGLMGIPLVAMNSPYEANFTNLLTSSHNRPSFISDNVNEYCLKVNSLLAGKNQPCPTSQSLFFEESFAPESLTCSTQTAIFSEQLNL